MHGRIFYMQSDYIYKFINIDISTVTLFHHVVLYIYNAVYYSFPGVNNEGRFREDKKKMFGCMSVNNICTIIGLLFALLEVYSFVRTMDKVNIMDVWMYVSNKIKINYIFGCMSVNNICDINGSVVCFIGCMYVYSYVCE